MEATLVPVNRQMDKEDVGCVYMSVMEYYLAIKRMKCFHLQQCG